MSDALLNACREDLARTVRRLEETEQRLRACQDSSVRDGDKIRELKAGRFRAQVSYEKLERIANEAIERVCVERDQLTTEIARLRAELTNALPAQVDARLQAAQRAHNAELRFAEACKLGVQTQLNAALAHKRNWKLAAKRALKRNGELHAELNQLRAEPTAKPRPTANQLCAQLRTWVEDATAAELDELFPAAQGLNSHWLNEVAALRRQLELAKETRQRHAETIGSVANALGSDSNATAMLRAISDLKEAPDLPSCAREFVSAREAEGALDRPLTTELLLRTESLWSHMRTGTVATKRHALAVSLGAIALRIAEEAGQ